MQDKEQYKSDLREREFFLNKEPHVVHVFSIYESLYRQDLEQYICLFPPFGYFRLNMFSQTLHLSIKPLNKGILCH